MWSLNPLTKRKRLLCGRVDTFRTVNAPALLIHSGRFFCFTSELDYDGNIVSSLTELASTWQYLFKYSHNLGQRLVTRSRTFRARGARLRVGAISTEERHGLTEKSSISVKVHNDFPHNEFHFIGQLSVPRSGDEPASTGSFFANAP